MASTWWGERWIGALERLVDAGRLSQGRWHARSGRVVRLEVAGSAVVARLQGGRAVPRTVTVRLAPLADGEWERVLAAMAAEARYSAQLLAGEMPDGIEAAFEAAGTSLFPRSAAGVSLACTCSEARRGLGPCKHAAAVCYVLGDRFDADPFLLFTLRGRSREQVQAALRARRTAGALEGAGLRPPVDASPSGGDFWACPGGDGALAAAEALLAAPSPDVARDAEAVLRLGPPPFWPDGGAFAAAMTAAYRIAGEYADEYARAAGRR